MTVDAPLADLYISGERGSPLARIAEPDAPDRLLRDLGCYPDLAGSWPALADLPNPSWGCWYLRCDARVASSERFSETQGLAACEHLNIESLRDATHQARKSTALALHLDCGGEGKAHGDGREK